MTVFIKKLSFLIWSNYWYRFFFLSLITVITVLFMGYYFGSFDQAIHIPFLKKYSNPTLYPNDPFFDLRQYHYSYFWFIFVPFYKAGILELSMFITHLIITFFTYWSIYLLSKTLFNSPIASFLSVIAFVFPHIGFAGFPVIEFSLLNRTFVLPFLLISINYYLKNKYILAYLILGLMYNFHVVSVNFVLIMFLFDLILRFSKIDLKKYIAGIILFVVFASPILIWKFSNSSVDVGLDKQWFNLVNKGFLYHIFTLITLNPYVLFLVINGISLFLIYFIIRKRMVNKFQSIINSFIFAALAVIIIQVLSSMFLPLTIIVQFQVIRIGVFVTIFTYLFLSNYVGQYLEKKQDKNNIRILFASLLLSTSPFIALIGLISTFFKNNFKKIIIVFIISSFPILLTLSFMMNIWRPGINIYPVKDELYKAEIWAKNNTPKDSVFIVPPYLWWFYNTEWRVVSERSIVASLSDLLEIAFLPSYTKYWLPRFESVAPNTINKFEGNVFDNIKSVSKSYNSLSETDILNISEKYNASFFVTEKNNFYNFPKVYENNKYTIYKLDFSNI